LPHAGIRVQEDPGIDSVALTVLAPSRLRSRRAWDAWRGQWPGRVQLLATDTLAQGAVSDGASVMLRPMERLPDDVVASALRWSATVSRDAKADREVRLYRLTRPDSLTGSRPPRAAAGEPSAPSEVVLLHWPLDGRPEGWVRREVSDTAGALVARGQVVVGPWERVARPDATLLRDSAVTPIAWWGDGEVAAVERRLSSTDDASRACLRSVAMRVPAGTDLLLGTAAEGLRHALRAPCGGTELPLDAVVASERVAGVRPPLLLANAIRGLAGDPVGASPSWLPLLLGGIACLALLAEWWWRRREDAR
jgi:hypothetical protein